MKNSVFKNEKDLFAEKLIPNDVKETLFVGVGGIGSQIVLKVASRCMPKEKENLKFVVMDTDVNELEAVKNKNENIVPIQTSSTQTVLDYLTADESASDRWFPVNTTLYPKTVSEGAGQVRAISRLALNTVIKSGRINALYNAIDDLFLKDGGQFKQALRVVIVSSAAGGTGSGIAMIIGMLIREYLHEHYREKAAIIRGYLLLPGVCDTFGPKETERLSLRRNGYATIKEINAFMMKASGFCGVRKDLERFSDICVEIPTSSGNYKKLEGLPFDFCFLLDRLDKSQSSMSTLEQYKEFAAQSLYEQNIGPMRTGSNSMEDNVIKEFANGDNLGRNRFGGIGASVIRYPYREVLNYVAFSRAIDIIGCSQNVADNDDGLKGWLKYDRAYKNAFVEYKKNRAFTADKEPKLSQVYVDSVNNGETLFDEDVKSYLKFVADDGVGIQVGVETRINEFLEAFKDEIVNAFMSRPSVEDNEECFERLRAFNFRTYASNNVGLTISADKSALDELKDEINNYAESIAKNRVRAILIGAPSAKGNVRNFHVESLFKTTGGMMHPNSMRYLLYALYNRLTSEEIDEDRDSIAYYTEEQRELKKSLQKYSAEYSPVDDRKSVFFVEKSKFCDKEPSTLDELCGVVDRILGKNYKEGNENKPGFTDVTNKAKQQLKKYCEEMMKYRNSVLFKVAYTELCEYVLGLCQQFEKFYNGFEEKAYSLRRKKSEIIDGLKFHKGDSFINICATEERLDKIYSICNETSSVLQLPEELNADIFDAIKKNAEVERTSRIDPRNAGARRDIFDEVLIDYFIRSVQKDCDEIINLNIIQAIKMQQSIDNELANGFENILSDADVNEYLSNVIRRGASLASPGIGFGNFDADRMMMLCAYNTALDAMLDINVKNFVESSDAGNGKLRSCSSNSVSKYEMRFFSALYDVTPDKLSRFRNPKDCKSSIAPEEEGIYYTAYHEYSNKIGPDSTKSGTISTHIDKRWDTIVELPEISMNSQYSEMVRIHSSLIYGIVHSFIISHSASYNYDEKKKIFALEDEEGDVKAFVVSNGSSCDKFYEILDALYRDNQSVGKIFDMAKERRRYDEESGMSYAESGFAADLDTFVIGNSHTGKTSLFEIPVMYYNSLPKSKLDSNELSTMVDSIISVLKQEIDRFEKEEDRGPLLVDVLQKQFELLVKNFNNSEYGEILRKHSTISDNDVVRVVLKKIVRTIKLLDVYNATEKINALKRLAAVS